MLEYYYFLHYCLGYLNVLFVHSFIHFIIILHCFALNVDLLAVWVICIYLERKKEKLMFRFGDFLIGDWSGLELVCTFRGAHSG